MSPLDASFLHLENATSPMHVASVAAFEGPVPAHRDVVATSESAVWWEPLTVLGHGPVVTANAETPCAAEGSGENW